MSSLHGEIDRLLAECRPDRYEVEGGDGWLDEVADKIASLIPQAEARRMAASAMVRRREGEQMKRTNRLLREIAESGQWPFDWLDQQHLPLAVGKERVSLRAVTADDLVLFAHDERRRAAADFSSRNATCEGAEKLAASMRAAECELLPDLDLGEAS